jgi:hypothetical protein
MNATSIEDRAQWATHRQAVVSARERGLCWWCAQKVGLAATDVPPTKPELCAACAKRWP